MLEFPELQTIVTQLQNNIVGKSVLSVLPPTKPHKFCWFNGNPELYHAKITGSKITAVECFGLYAEISFNNGQKLCFNDGINLRLLGRAFPVKDYQLLIELSQDCKLVFTVAMYGGIVLHDGNYNNEYYLKSKQSVSPLSPEFTSLYHKKIDDCKPTLSVKAFMATEQRFPGIGNGVLQDVLFAAGLNPKRKIATLSASEKDELLYCTTAVLSEMAEKGGRDTEKDIFGRSGGYKTKLSKLNAKATCPQCGGVVIKEAYLGGSVYYCPFCQPLSKD